MSISVAGSGGFDIFNTLDGLDLSRAGYSDQLDLCGKTIDGITVFGNKIYVATGYGVSVYLPALETVSLAQPQLNSHRFRLRIASSRSSMMASFVFAAAHEGVVWVGDASDLHASSNWHSCPIPAVLFVHLQSSTGRSMRELPMDFSQSRKAAIRLNQSHCSSRSRSTATCNG